MKINLLKFAACATVLSLAACTNDVVEIPGNLENQLSLPQGQDVIRISLTNTTSTRAARPVSSSEADNNVNRIAFKFLNSSNQAVEGISLEGVVDAVSGDEDPDFESVSNVLHLPDSYDGSEINIKFSGLQEGSYKIIAYGYNYTEGTDIQDTFPYTIDVKGSGYLLKCEGVSSAIQEIFAGCNEGDLIGVNQHGKFQTVPKITLSRQVAGLLAYFKEAPVFVDNKKVKKVTVSTKVAITGFYFPASLLSDAYSGIGDVSTAWVDYLTFDMQQASNYKSQYLESGDFYEFSDSYLLANETNPIDGLTCQENTLFGSRFLLPFSGYRDLSVGGYDCATLNICYWAEDDTLIKSVSLRNGGSEDDELRSDSYQYGILCNNFYSIGTKKGTGDNPGDNPISIDEPTGYDHAEVDINDDWIQSHSLIN